MWIVGFAAHPVILGNNRREMYTLFEGTFFDKTGDEDLTLETDFA